MKPFPDTKIDHGRDHEMSLSLPLLLMGSLIAELYRVGTSSSGKDSLAPLQVAGRSFLGRP